MTFKSASADIFVLNDHYETMRENGMELKYYFYTLAKGESNSSNRWRMVTWDQRIRISDWKDGDFLIFKQDGVVITDEELLQMGIY